MIEKKFIKKISDKYVAIIYIFNDNEELTDIKTKILNSKNRKEMMLEAKRLFNSEEDFKMVFPSSILKR